MPGEEKTEGQLQQELGLLRWRLAELEQEIAGRKLVEQEIAKLAKLHSENPNPILRISSDCTILYANDASSIVLQTWQRQVGQALPEPCCQRVQEAIRSGKVSTLEFTCMDGRTFLVTLVPVAQEGYLNAYGVDVTGWKNAEAAVKENEAKYRDLVEEMTDVIYTLDTEGKVTSVNKAGRAMFVREPQDIIGKPFTDWIPPGKLPDAMAVFKRILAGERVIAETVLIDKDGGSHDVEFNSTPIIRDGVIVGTRGIIRDITARKKVEQELQESHKKYRELVDNITDGVYRTDTKGNFTYVNKIIEQRSGIPAEKFVGLNFRDFVPSEYHQVISANLAKLLAGEQVQPVVLEYPTATGQTVTIETNARPIYDGNTITGIQGMTRDITQRKKAEEKLKDSEATLRAIIDSATESVLLMDTDGIILAANRTLAERLGTTLHELIGKCVYDVLPPDLAESRKLQAEKVVRTGEPVIFEDIRGERDILNSLSPIKDSVGRVRKLAIFALDVTKLRETRERLEYILATTPATTYTCKVGGNWQDTFMSGNVSSQFGYEPRQFVEDPNFWSAHIHPDDRQRVLAELSGLFEKGFHVHEYRFLHKNGDYRWVRDELRLIRDQKGQPLECIGYITDVTERKQAEEYLRQSELRYHTLFESSPVGIGLGTIDGKILEFNTTMLRMSGYADTEIRQVNLKDIYVDPGDRARLIERLQTHGSVHDFEVQLKRKDGTTYWANLTVMPFPFAGQDTVLTVQVDVTERKKAQEALREAEQKWRCLAENAPDVILTVKPDGTIAFMNRTVPPYTPEEAIGTSVYDYVLPEYRDVMRHALEQVVQTGQPHSYELAGKGPDGRTSWYRSRLGPIKQGGQVVAVTLIATDVTERKQTEDALRQSENKYKTLLENLPQRIFLKDTNSVYVSCNQNYASDLKIKPEQIAGRTDYDFYPKELAEKYRTDDKEIIQSGRTTEIEEKYILDGQESIVYTVKTPIRDEHGNIIGILGIFWDITESRRQERELNLYRERMARAERLASLGTLSATMAHELTQPLTAVVLSIENSLAELEAGPYPADVVEGLRDGLEAVSHATSIIDRLRHFARQSSEKAITEVRLAEVAQKTVRLLDKRAQQANISLHLQGLEELPPIYVHEKDMEQLFFALGDNAIHAAEGKKKRQLTISGAVKGQYIELQFADNCGGIATEDLDRIFEPFFTTRPTGEGTGLGLCIVQHIVSRAGGKVWVENRPGKGATFFVALPMSASIM